MCLATDYYIRYPRGSLVTQHWRATGVECVRTTWFCWKATREGLRVSLLSPVVPVDRGISSCAIDGGLHLLTAAIVAVLGISITLLHFPLSGHWRVYASVLSAVLIAVVVTAVVAVGSGWQLMGGVARAIGKLPQLHSWVIGKQPTIDSAEHNLITF